MRAVAAIPRWLQGRIDREIKPGERVQWAQMPIPRFFTPASTAVFVFGLIATAFMVSWIASIGGWQWPGLHRGLESAFPFLGVPGLLIGIGLLCSPLYARWKAHRTVYVITDRRAVIFDGGITMEVRSFLPEELHEVYRRQKRDGTGHVILGRRVFHDSDGDAQTMELGFFHIRNPEEVERLVKGLAAGRIERFQGSEG